MGKGGEQQLVQTGSGRILSRSPSVLSKLNALTESFDARQRVRKLRNDLVVLKTIWFKQLKESGDHAERLEQFYGPQAHACKFASCE